MLHKNRTWFISRVDSPESLASMLVDQVWTGCQGWQLEKYLLLNDATCPDGAQEYGIFLPIESDSDRLTQIESITFSWCTVANSESHLTSMLEGAFNRNVLDSLPRPLVQTEDQHGKCPLCL